MARHLVSPGRPLTPPPLPSASPSPGTRLPGPPPRLSRGPSVISSAWGSGPAAQSRPRPVQAGIVSRVPLRPLLPTCLVLPGSRGRLVPPGWGGGVLFLLLQRGRRLAGPSLAPRSGAQGGPPQLAESAVLEWLEVFALLPCLARS